MEGKVIAVAMQKGGVGKTFTTASLGVGLARLGKKVLLIDCDPQGSLSISLGHLSPNGIPVTLATMMEKVIREEDFQSDEGILPHEEGVHLLASNKHLAGIEVALVNVMSRETILKQYINIVKRNYDLILLDCSPSLGVLTVNALAAADSVIIPVQAQYLSAKGLEQLISTIQNVRRFINPGLAIDGILLTMVDNRTNFSKEITTLLRDNYSSKIKVFETQIPYSVRATESTAMGKSIFAHDPNGKVAEAYRKLIEEVVSHEK